MLSRRFASVFLLTACVAFFLLFVPLVAADLSGISQAPVLISFSTYTGLTLDAASQCDASVGSGKPSGSTIECSKPVYALMPFNALAFSVRNPSSNPLSLQFSGGDNCYSVVSASAFKAASIFDPSGLPALSPSDAIVPANGVQTYLLAFHPSSKCVSYLPLLGADSVHSSLTLSDEASKGVVVTVGQTTVYGSTPVSLQFSVKAETSDADYLGLVAMPIGPVYSRAKPGQSFEEPAVFANNLPVKGVRAVFKLSGSAPSANSFTVPAQSALGATLKLDPSSSLHLSLGVHEISSLVNVVPASGASLPFQPVGKLNKVDESTSDEWLDCSGVDYCSLDSLEVEQKGMQEDLASFASEYADSLDGVLAASGLSTTVRVPVKEAGSSGGIKLLTYALTFNSAAAASDSRVAAPVSANLLSLGGANAGYPYLQADAIGKFKLKNWPYPQPVELTAYGPVLAGASVASLDSKVRVSVLFTRWSGSSMSFADAVPNLDGKLAYASKMADVFYKDAPGTESLKVCQLSNPGQFDSPDSTFAFCANPEAGHKPDYIYVDGEGFLQRTARGQSGCDCFVLASGSNVPPALGVTQAAFDAWRKSKKTGSSSGTSPASGPLAVSTPSGPGPLPTGVPVTPGVGPSGRAPPPVAPTVPVSPKPTTKLPISGLNLYAMNKWPLTFSSADDGGADEMVAKFFNEKLDGRWLKDASDTQVVTIVSSKVDSTDAQGLLGSAMFKPGERKLAIKVACKAAGGNDCGDFDASAKDLLAYLFDPSASLSGDSLSGCTASDDGLGVTCSAVKKAAPVVKKPASKLDDHFDGTGVCSGFKVDLRPAGAFGGKSTDAIALKIQLNPSAKKVSTLPGSTLSFLTAQQQRGPPASASPRGPLKPSQSRVRITVQLIPMSVPVDNKRSPVPKQLVSVTYCNAKDGAAPDSKSKSTCDKALNFLVFDSDSVKLSDLHIMESAEGKQAYVFSKSGGKEIFKVVSDQAVRVKVYVVQIYVDASGKDAQCSTPDAGVGIEYGLKDLVKSKPVVKPKPAPTLKKTVKKTSVRPSRPPRGPVLPTVRSNTCTVAGGRSGTCKSTASCSGLFESVQGACPGWPTDVQCCVRKATSNVRPPPARPPVATKKYKWSDSCTGNDGLQGVCGPAQYCTSTTAHISQTCRPNDYGTDLVCCTRPVARPKPQPVVKPCRQITLASECKWYSNRCTYTDLQGDYICFCNLYAQNDALGGFTNVMNRLTGGRVLPRSKSSVVYNSYACPNEAFYVCSITGRQYPGRFSCTPR